MKAIFLLASHFYLDHVAAFSGLYHFWANFFPLIKPQVAIWRNSAHLLLEEDASRWVSSMIWGTSKFQAGRDTFVATVGFYILQFVLWLDQDKLSAALPSRLFYRRMCAQIYWSFLFPDHFSPFRLFVNCRCSCRDEKCVNSCAQFT